MKRLLFILALMIGANANAQVPIFAGKKPTDYPLKPQLDGSEEIYSQRDITGIRNQRFFVNQIMDYARCALPTDSVYVKNDSICIKRRGVNSCPTGNCFSIKQLNFVDSMRVSNDTLYYRKKLIWYGLKLPSGGGGPAVDSSKWQRVNNKLQPKNTIDSVLLHKKLILDDYKNSNTNIPILQTKIATGLSYNNIFNEIQAEQACDASGFTTLPTINTINGSMYNFTPTTCGLAEDVWELSLNFPITYSGCPGGYIDEIRVRTIGVSNNGGGYGTCLKVDGINTEYNGQPIYSDETQNAPFDYYFIDTTNRVSISSILATFLWEGTADLGLDGMEVILKIGGCENKYIVLTTNTDGIVKLDTLPNFITLDDLPTPASENFANTDLTFTGSRFHNANFNGLVLNNLSSYIEDVTDGTNTVITTISPQQVQTNIQDGTNNFGYSSQIGNNSYENFVDNNTGGTLSIQYFPHRGSGIKHFNVGSQGSSGMLYEGIYTEDTTVTLAVAPDGIVGTESWIKLQPTSMQLRTKTNISGMAAPGQVLTLIDPSTGECDWATAGVSNIYNSNGILNGYRTIDANDNPIDFINTSGVSFSDGGNGQPFVISNINQNNSGSIYSVEVQGISDISNAPNSGGVKLSGETYQNTGLLLQGNSSQSEDIIINPINSKLKIQNLNTDNTATQVMGKDANGYSVWVDKSSIAGSFAGITTVNAGSGLTKINDSTLALGGVLTNYLSIDGTINSQRIDIAGKDNNVGIQITGLSSNIYSAAQFVGANSGSGADIEIAPINGKLFISSLPTYNDATQVLGLNNLGNCAWVAKNPVGTTAQRPITPIQGMERFNSTILGKELFDGTNWIILSGTWTTGTRPTGIGAGSTGFNTTLSQKEYWNGSTWIQF